MQHGTHPRELQGLKTRHDADGRYLRTTCWATQTRSLQTPYSRVTYFSFLICTERQERRSWSGDDDGATEIEEEVVGIPGPTTIAMLNQGQEQLQILVGAGAGGGEQGGLHCQRWWRRRGDQGQKVVSSRQPAWAVSPSQPLGAVVFFSFFPFTETQDLITFGIAIASSRRDGNYIKGRNNRKYHKKINIHTSAGLSQRA